MKLNKKCTLFYLEYIKWNCTNMYNNSKWKVQGSARSTPRTLSSAQLPSISWRTSFLFFMLLPATVDLYFIQQYNIDFYCGCCFSVDNTFKVFFSPCHSIIGVDHLIAFEANQFCLSLDCIWACARTLSSICHSCARHLPKSH